MPQTVTLDMSTAQPLTSGVKLDMSTAQPLDRGGGDTDKPSLLHRVANNPNDIPLDSYAHATERGFANIGQGVAQTGEALIHPIDTAKSLWGALKGYGSALAGNEEAADNIVNSVKQPFSSPLAFGDAAGRGAGQVISGMAGDEALSLAGKGVGAAASTTGKALGTASRAVVKATGAAGEYLDPDIVGIVSPRAGNLLRTAQKAGKVADVISSKLPDAAQGLKEVEAAQPETAEHLAQVIADDKAMRAAAAEKLPLSQGTPDMEALRAESEARLRAVSQPPEAESEGLPEVEQGQPQASALLQKAIEPNQTGNFSAENAKPNPGEESFPRTLQGDSALRKVLTGQDNANLMKIAKSRGINITQESKLKPGAGDSLLINKIIDNFAPEELDDFRDRYLESTRFRHDFGDIGPEAWKTISLQTYFPDLKLPQTLINRTHAAILKSAASRLEAATPAAEPSEDLTPLLQESLKRIQANR